MSYGKNYDAIDWSKPIDIKKKVVHEYQNKRSDFPAPMIARDYKAYECPVTGKMIEGRSAHKENLKRTGCRLLEPGEKEHNTKRGRKEVDAKLDAAIEKSVNEVAKDYFA